VAARVNKNAIYSYLDLKDAVEMLLVIFKKKLFFNDKSASKIKKLF